jgi:hypothetical protein
MMVASIICRVASHIPLPARASRITSQTPLSAHRRNCRKIEFQLPNSSGRSRHGAPVRINQKTASSTRRWLRGGRPPRRIRKGSKYAHSSSVISPRIKAALPQRAALNQFTIPASIDLSTRPSAARQEQERGLTGDRPHCGPTRRPQHRRPVPRARQDLRECTACHAPGFTYEVSRKANFSGINVSKVTNLYGTGMTWEFVDRLREIVKGKLVLKGIMTGEDAKEAMRHGVDGIQVSNHGGRAEESGQATISVLVEVVDAVNGRIPVLIDGGVRRGTDVLKALGLGEAPSALAGPTCGGSPRSAKQVWTVCSRFWTMSSSRSCDRSAH